MQVILKKFKEPKFRSRAILISLALLFIFPVIAAYVLFYIYEWRPASTINTGQLIQPIQTLPNLDFITVENKNFKLSDLTHKWILVSISNGQCDELCLARLHKMRQLHIAMADKQDRIERLFLINSKQGNTQSIKRLSGSYPKMHIVSGPNNAINELVNSVDKVTDPGEVIFDKIYLIDPIGNLIMYYPQDAESKGMLKDLSRLLRFSHLG